MSAHTTKVESMAERAHEISSKHGTAEHIYHPRIRSYGRRVEAALPGTLTLIAALAFPYAPALAQSAKIGILAGSLLSALVGYLILRTAPAAAATPEEEEDYIDVFASDEPDDERLRRGG